MKLSHLFIPHHKNNHRAKLLHNISLFTLIVFISFSTSLTLFIHKTHPDVLGISYRITNNELLNLTNFERAQKNLPPLRLNNKLSQAASKKADYMFKHNFWAHFAPDGTSPWKFIKDEGYEYLFAGENLAKGFTTSEDAVVAWMNSPTHKANIMSDQYSEIGFAIKEGRLSGEDTILIVQMFGMPVNGVANDGSVQPEPEVQGSSQYQVPLPEASYGATNNPSINIVFVTKTITFLLLSVLLIALVLDFVIIRKKQIPRSVGNNIDHIMLVTIFLSFLIMARIGNII